MKKILLHLFIFTLIFASCAPTTEISSDKTPSLPLTDCVLTSPSTSYQVDARCGSMLVLENPGNPQGRQITLNIAVVPSIKRVPEPDPLVILVGGPGQAAVEVFPILFTTLFNIHQTRDILLVDQRGTGKSHPLRCLDPDQELLDDAQLVSLLKACPQKLDADLQYYTTDIAMQDLESVRVALGYEHLNLYGVSYGTRAALVYLKMYPERVRSITLDAVVDPAFVIYQDVMRDGQRALDLFLARCEMDKTCNEAYPNLRTEFSSLLGGLEEHPETITITHPITGKPFTLTITSSLLENIVFNTLYTPDLLATLPLTIHQADVNHNFAPLITLSYLSDAGIYDGMFYSVACTEDAPLLSGQDIFDGLFGEGVQAFMDVCSAWPKGKTPDVIHEQVSSNVPALLMSGEADPITPPWHAEQLAEQLQNEIHLLFKGMGHGNSSNQCGSRILANFIETASIQELDTSCVNKVEPPPFFTDFSGPHP